MPDRRADGPHRLTVELMEQRLAALLDSPREDLAAARAAAAADWPGWVRRLLDDVEVSGLVMDPAWHEPESVDPYAEVCGRPVWELQRLEPTIDAVIERGGSALDVIDAVDKLMTDAAARGVVGFKTVVAYRTGLAVAPEVSLATAQSSLGERRPVRRRAKALRDHVFRHALGRCVDLGLPMQVHTGFGDGDIRPRDSDPLLLGDLLRTPEARAATVVLIHGSWPWHDSLGYLTSVNPNVWAELSLVQLMAPATTAERLLRLLEVAPTNRVLLGSDGHGSIESIWFGCRLLHEAWESAAAALAAAGAGAAWLEAVHDGIFERNAQRAYALPG